ncbi:hypothetical protein MCG98_01165 [Ruminococcus sp. OA3]|uniref:hypothetical protein n=1 Tax=Ruminococcus sp. OA3 TaxID=2914164 RepID=UPI001F06E3AE|nr:hypothetical protein [Ruminococcus sp. OA3]MCH1981186.1 hypothetical protein [Ruminococcus sp. OA3]
MKKLIRSVFSTLLLCLCLAACVQKSKIETWKTPEKAAESVMHALKTLDLETLNESGDDYVSTERNWIGFPTRKEYRVFNELLQPALFKGRKYKANKKFAEKIVENLSWEISEVQENKDQADIKMKIMNEDMSDVMGYYMIGIMERMLKAEGSGLKQMIRDLSNIDYDKGGVLSYMDRAEGISSTDVTVRAYQGDEGWKLHISDSFINAFMGNLDANHLSEDVEKHLCELEDEYEQVIAKNKELNKKRTRWECDIPPGPSNVQIYLV